ncbi:MAG: NAD(P)-dependent oxidoreductase [Inquilinus sp.]|nr:NAD(P)-dependent oxidoreductase [Inquilinus sp.]
MKILVTGSAGHLGEAVVRSLEGFRTAAIGLDVHPSPFTRRVGSITDRAFVADSLAGVDAVIHAATLHKPHVATHGARDFVDTNITGTLTLLEEAVRAGVGAFVFTSTTSAFGAALVPEPGAPAAWITEQVRPVPRNIYGVTKVAAEDLCELFHRRHGLPCLVLRTSRFFPEADDDPARRAAFADENAKANEFLFRRADLEDVVQAHLRAVERAPALGFGRYIVSATTPFGAGDLARLRTDAPGVVAERFPDYAAVYGHRGWRMFPSIDRVYVNERARRDLGWNPVYDFARVLAQAAAGEPIGSPLAHAVGSKGYHDEVFEDGPYPVV